jgi:hypothetical protein
VLDSGWCLKTKKNEMLEGLVKTKRNEREEQKRRADKERRKSENQGAVEVAKMQVQRSKHEEITLKIIDKKD